MQNILAIFLPFIIGAVNTKVPTARGRFWVSIAISIIIGIALNIGQVPSFNTTNPQLFLSSLATFIVYVGLVVGTAQATYLKYWQNHPAFVTLFGQPDSKTPQMPIAATTQQPAATTPPSDATVAATSAQPTNDSQNSQQTV